MSGVHASSAPVPPSYFRLRKAQHLDPQLSNLQTAKAQLLKSGKSS